ncbi:LysR family transcriptional regulator [Yersinia enterocolitica]|jgi:DNA-binding transcriptional LysR family regulator|uniref:LysR family transcriptional regulator n=1 Tax=Yersinia TaxID=629 RepID=UPI0003158887|nr:MULTISPECIES: LysR family transcriptional regulator [Yersinia]HEC1649800.1 LysR family transcriptional regulator [Yersinia enterocolitica]ATM86415.1 LysR family transcriptional regulator [Yersinia frederiksenii]MCB5306671.1 LysR family transcriptional regulator [Yersinia massiliensis]MCB5317132.1 LysR family transcriptional regulator [Yersinia massiliensis]CNK53984.1 DNA-binding transcriptional activator XapR [Yersinia frederiksenii]
MQKLLFSGRINLKMIRYFLAVSEELHFGKAAERLHISQPPLSLQIKELEEALGFPLFIRDSRNVVLTLAGEMMQAEMKEVFENIENSLSRVSYIARHEQSHLNIGIIGSALWHQLLEKFKHFKTLNPHTTWSLHEFPPSKQFDALLNKKLDIGFWRCADLEQNPALIYQRVEKQRVSVAVSYESELAEYDVLSLKDLSGQTLIFLTFTHSGYSKNLYNCCLSAGCQPQGIYQFDEPQTQLAFVNSNLGIALVPESMQEIPWPNIKFIPLQEYLSADLFAVYPPDNASPALERLLELF